MSRINKVTPYDAFILESFQMGKNANEVYETVNARSKLLNQKPVLTRRAIYYRYNRWVEEGKPGEMYSEQYRNDNNEIVIVWRLKDK